MGKFNSMQKIGTIATEFPGSMDLFKEYRIDFCCGGDRPLIEAIEEKGLIEKEVVDRLNEAYEKFDSGQPADDTDWMAMPVVELVDHIVNKHHAYLWSELPKIGELATTILRVHGANHQELFRVHKLFSDLKAELESHLTKEETVQYPSIKRFAMSGSSEDLADAIKVIEELENEHVGAGDILKELRLITNDFTPPADGCMTYKLTYSKLQELESDVFQHIHLENNILFPRLAGLGEKQGNGRVTGSK